MAYAMWGTYFLLLLQFLLFQSGYLGVIHVLAESGSFLPSFYTHPVSSIFESCVSHVLPHVPYCD